MPTPPEHGPLTSTAENARTSLIGLDRERLGVVLAPYLDRPFRADQIYRAIHERSVCEWSALTELSARLRTELAEHFTIAWPEIAEERHAADGTLKVLFRLADGKTIESVDIPDRRRRTLCLSSQAGCALACRFCVTGFWGAGRNLTAGEIVSQVLALRARTDRPPADGLNLVFMGMGEPLLNLENLHAALEILFEQISWRRITVSTVGIIPGLEAMAQWPRRPQLAISLHAPDDARRSALMPVNRSYPLRDLLACLRRYPLAPKQRITFEYILIRGQNDALDDADALANLLRGLPAKVNLIPLNPDSVLDDDMVPPTLEAVTQFRDRLRAKNMTATVRKQRGDDVSAACGQLRAPDRTPRGFRRSNLRW